MADFTPGPIEIVKFDAPLSDWTGSRFCLRSPEAPGGVVLVMGGLGEAEERANAQLYAASPKMYVALSLLIDNEPCEYDHHGNCQTHNLGNPCAVALGLAALAKAEGRTP